MELEPGQLLMVRSRLPDQVIRLLPASAEHQAASRWELKRGTPTQSTTITDSQLFYYYGSSSPVTWLTRGPR